MSVQQYHFQLDPSNLTLVPHVIVPGSEPVVVSVSHSYDEQSGHTASVSWAGRVQGYFTYSTEGNVVISIMPTSQDPATLFSLNNIATSI